MWCEIFAARNHPMQAELDEELLNNEIPEEFEEMLSEVKKKNFTIEDVLGRKQVVLTRVNGIETWTVQFSVDDLMGNDDDEMGGLGGMGGEEGQEGQDAQSEVGEQPEMGSTLMFTATVKRPGGNAIAV